MSLALQWLSAALLGLGALACLIGGIGLLRMPDFFTRMHAASVIETLGVALILLGLMLQAGLTLIAVKLLIMGVLVFFVSPIASHALAKAALLRGVKPLLADEGDAPSKR